MTVMCLFIEDNGIYFNPTAASKYAVGKSPINSILNVYTKPIFADGKHLKVFAIGNFQYNFYRGFKQKKGDLSQCTNNMAILNEFNYSIGQ